MARTKQLEPKRIGAAKAKRPDAAGKPAKKEPTKIKWSQDTLFKREYLRLTGKGQSLRGLLPRAVIIRVCKEILHENNAFMGGTASVTMIAGSAMKALEQSLDSFAHTLFERTAEATHHAKRTTATLDDLRYALRQLHGSNGLTFTDTDVIAALEKP